MKSIITIKIFISAQILRCRLCNSVLAGSTNAQHSCGNSGVCIIAGNDYCYSYEYTTRDGSRIFKRGCARERPGLPQTICSNNVVAFQNFLPKQTLSSITSSSGTCCTRNNCNNNLPPLKSKSNLNRCHLCYYQSNYAKPFQKCSGATVECPTGYCYSVNYTRSNVINVVEKGCDISPTDRYCQKGADTCQSRTRQVSLQSCSCCNNDLCNGGAIHPPVKFILGFLFFIVLVFLY